MLGKRPLQESFLTVEHQYLSFVGRDSFYGYLAEHRHEVFRDEDFASLYCEDNGRPSVPPSLLACALLLQWYDSVSDEEATQRAKYDLRWKVGLGLEMDEEPFAKSTLWLFRTQLIVHQQARKLFEASLKHARQKGYFKSRAVKVALDTTPIFGRGAVLDTYNLLAESLRQVLRVLAKLEDTSFASFACEHDFRRYSEPSFKGTVSIDWDNESQRQVVLQALVTDCDRVLALARTLLAQYPADSDQARQILEATDLLSKILSQDVQRTPSGEASLIQGVAEDRIVSVHDPQMRHGRKSVSQRFDGYKASLAVDTESQLVSAVDCLAGNAHDSTKVEELLEQAEQNTEATILTIIGDTAYGSAEQRLDAQKKERTLVAPVPKAPATGRFTKDDFQIDLATDTVRCPAGKPTTDWYVQKRRTKRGRELLYKTFRFSQEQCQDCPLSQKCLKPPARWRTVTVHPQEALLQRAKQFQRTEEFQRLYRLRSTVEHRIARLLQVGLRKARYFGTAKVLFQVAMTAAVANLTLVASWADGTRVPFCLFSLLLLILAVMPFSAPKELSPTTLGLMAARTALPVSTGRLIAQRETKTMGFRLRF